MPVLWITVILSVLLALVFLMLFIKEHGRFHFGSPERSALMPLEEDSPPLHPISAPKRQQPVSSAKPTNQKRIP
jgi:hypothetical protein